MQAALNEAMDITFEGVMNDIESIESTNIAQTILDMVQKTLLPEQWAALIAAHPTAHLQTAATVETGGSSDSALFVHAQ